MGSSAKAAAALPDKKQEVRTLKQILYQTSSAPQKDMDVPKAKKPRQKRKTAQVASAKQVIQELTEIGMGHAAVTQDGTPGKLPTVAERLRALELLGKTYRLFTDGGAAEGQENPLAITIRVVD